VYAGAARGSRNPARLQGVHSHQRASARAGLSRRNQRSQVRILPRVRVWCWSIRRCACHPGHVDVDDVTRSDHSPSTCHSVCHRYALAGAGLIDDVRVVFERRRGRFVAGTRAPCPRSVDPAFEASSTSATAHRERPWPSATESILRASRVGSRRPRERELLEDVGALQRCANRCAPVRLESFRPLLRASPCRRPACCPAADRGTARRRTCGQSAQVGRVSHRAGRRCSR
jgi:hypothetical protein